MESSFYSAQPYIKKKSGPRWLQMGVLGFFFYFQTFLTSIVCTLCFSSAVYSWVFWIRFHWLRIQEFCWTPRIQYWSGSRPGKNYIRKTDLFFFWNPLNDVQALQTWIFFLFTFMVDNFGPPGSGFPINLIRIRWPNYIQIHNNLSLFLVCPYSAFLYVSWLFFYLAPYACLFYTYLSACLSESINALFRTRIHWIRI